MADALKRQLYIALAISGAIVLATLVDDVITAGAGVADDVAVFSAASYSIKKQLKELS